MKHLKKTTPQRAEETDQHSLDAAARADAFQAIRQGLEDVARGRTRPAREVFEEIRHKHGIPR